MEIDLEKTLQTISQSPGFAKEIGVEITEAHNGHAEGVMQADARHLNPMGNIHGGCIFTLMDTVCGMAARSRGSMVVTSSANVLFLNAGAAGSRLRAVATEVKNGRTLKVYDVQVFDAKEVVVAKASFTFFVSGQPLHL